MTREMTPKRAQTIIDQFHKYEALYATQGVGRRSFLKAIAAGTAAATVLPTLVAGGVASAAEVAQAQSDAIRAQDASPAATPGGTVIIASSGEAAGLNPLTTNDSEGTFRINQLFDQLVRLDLETLEVKPNIAKSWEISEDNLTYTFALEENVTFHDGTPLTANDVAFTLQGILTKDVASPFLSTFSAIAGAAEFTEGTADTVSGIEVIDDHTIAITLSEPNAPFLAGLRNVRPLPQHLLDGKSLTEDAFFQAPIGAGPFTFTSWTSGTDFVAAKNASYWKADRPYLDGFTHRTIADLQTLGVALQTGEVQASEYALPTQAEQFQAESTLTVLNKPEGKDINGFAFGQNNNEVLKDVRVRKAIALALDAEAFVEDFLLGLGTTAVGPIAASNWAFDTELAAIPYDPDQAAALLEEAGVGEITLTATTNSGNQFREDWVTFTQQSLAEFGITIEPDIKEWTQVVADLTNGTFDLIAPTYTGALVDPDELYDTLHSNGSRNVKGYANPELDALLEEGRVTLDLEARKEIYKQVQAIALEDVPVYWAWNRPFISVISTDYQGWTNTVFWVYDELENWSKVAAE